PQGRHIGSVFCGATTDHPFHVLPQDDDPLYLLPLRDAPSARRGSRMSPPANRRFSCRRGRLRALAANLFPARMAVLPGAVSGALPAYLGSLLRRPPPIAERSTAGMAGTGVGGAAGGNGPARARAVSGSAARHAGTGFRPACRPENGQRVA